MVNKRWQTNGTPQVVSILSGKGGVGKSVLAFNLADQLAAQGMRVLLVDADFAAGSLHLLANTPARVGINEYLTRQLSLREAITAVSTNVSLLAASWNEQLAETRSIPATAKLVNNLRKDASQDFDLIVMDHASGRSNQAATLAHASDLNILVVVPALTSLTDAYGLYKFLAGLNQELSCGLIINRAQTEEEVTYIRTKFPELSKQFLGAQPTFLGSISEHEMVRKAIAAQSPLSVIAPESVSTREMINTANALYDMLLGRPQGGRMNPFGQINKSIATADIRG